MEKVVCIISHLSGGCSTQHAEIKKTLRPHANMLYMVILVRKKTERFPFFFFFLLYLFVLTILLLNFAEPFIWM